MRVQTYCVRSEILTKNILRKFLHFKGFGQFLSEFSKFLKTVFSAVDCMKLLTIIEAKMGQNGRYKCATFI